MPRFSCLLLCLPLLACSGDPDDPPTSAAKEILRRRVAALEEENRQLAAENDRLTRELGELRAAGPGGHPGSTGVDEAGNPLDPEQRIENLQAEREELIEALAGQSEQFEQQIALLEAMNRAFEEEIETLELQIGVLEAENMRLAEDR